MTIETAREPVRKEPDPTQEKKPRPMPHNESDDVFGFVPGHFMPGGGAL